MPRNKWKGWYNDEDGDKQDMIFRSVKTKSDSVTGEGENDDGDFTLEGTIDGREIEFTQVT